MKKYDHREIEGKWQKEWADKKIFEAEQGRDKPKFYALIEFPYPSGQGLHVGHVRSNTAMDIIARKRRMEGFNVLYPIGWDAFGLPTENYAIKTGKDPRIVTKENTDTFRRQLQSLGFSFDWSREVNTTDPAYYKWTQWIFLQMFKQGLAYKKKMTINWCPKDKIGLANEEVIGGCCERCGTQVEKREKDQWMLAITKYADRLDKDLDMVDYLPQIKTQQRNWIGKSEGAEISFQVIADSLPEEKESESVLKAISYKLEAINVFTTRPDTLFGVTYLVLAPESPCIENWKLKIENYSEVEGYIEAIKGKTDIDRTDATKEKTGVELKGIRAINPANSEEIPVWIADYVLADYGTGAIMAVPAHDERDFDFAQKYNLPIKNVVIPRLVDKTNPHVSGKEVVFRDAIIAVVKNPKTNTFLCLKWKKQPWVTFVMGGIEKGEDPVTAALREIREETGYKNIKLVKMLGDAQSEFYAAHKGVNRVAHTRNIYFELIDEEKDEVTKEEADAYDIEWRTLSEISAPDMTHSEMQLILQGIKNTGFFHDAEEYILVNSGEFTGLNSEEAKKKITEAVSGKIVTTYKLRDWVFSRQRYWGEPIPLIHCDACGWVPVAEKDLPVELPQVEKYEPTDNGESPLALVSEWVNTVCPTCGGKARRETDTMPNWAGSSWYYLAYTSQGISNFQFPISKTPTEYWFSSSPEAMSQKLEAISAGPVDWYNGGMEHTTLHLLYSRFWHKFLFDQGLVPTQEPYQKRTSHGLILAEGGEKMSKSKGNVVNPDDIVATWGADSFRMFEMFMGPFDQPVSWNTDNIIGVRRFLERVWGYVYQWNENRKEDLQNGDQFYKSDGEFNLEVEIQLNKTIKKVSEDIENMQFNTAVSSLMMFLNVIRKETPGMFTKSVPLTDKQMFSFLKLLSPFAPHMTEELWAELGHTELLSGQPWPVADMSKVVETEVTVVVQVNGKVRGEVKVAIDSDEKAVLASVGLVEELKKWIGDNEPKKVIYVKNRLINIVL